MYPFEFEMPTKIVFGEGSIGKVGKIAQSFGSKALVLTYKEEFGKRTGYFEKLKQGCEKAGVKVIPFFGVKSNPEAEHAAQAISLAKKEKPDVIIALGGGSVMDEAKYIGVGAFYDGDAWDLVSGKAEITATIPVIAVNTVPATSSELNGISVMSNATLQRKEAFSSSVMKPAVCVLDPELTYSLSIERTVYSAADIMSHLLEHYLGNQLAFTPYQDHFCEGGIRSIMECVERLIKDRRDKDARALMMWQAAFAWSGFYNAGYGLANSNIHIIGHSFSNYYDTPHGAAMSVAILATMRYQFSRKPGKIAQFAREVFGVRTADDAIAASAGIAALEAWFRKVGAPTTLAEAGITDPDAIDKMVPDALETAQAWGEKDEYGYNSNMLREMFELCK